MRTMMIAVLAALATAGSGAAATPTSLTITAWPQGTAGPSQTRTLRCSPPRGTLPARAQACRRLALLANPFAPIPDDVVCTEIYGGPQVALVRGTFRGRRVWAQFQRRNGCEISRWDRVRFLFPPLDA